MSLNNSLNGFDGAQELLIKLVEQSPNDWPTRKRVGQVLFDAGFHREASELVWAAPEVPPVTEDVVFTTRVVAMGHPKRAVRLVSTMIEANKDSPEENLYIAKALMKEGLVLQALRFYGAATSMDLGLMDEEFEMILITADSNDENWRDLTEGDDFPWESPQDSTVVDLLDSDDEDASAAELLLSSVTQRVPLKAPVKHTSATTEKAPATDKTPEASATPARPVKPALSPAAEAIVKQQSEKAVASDSQTSDDSSSPELVNFLKHKEEAESREDSNKAKEPFKAAKAPIEAESSPAKPEPTLKVEEPVAKTDEAAKKLPKLKVDEPASKPKARLVTEAAKEEAKPKILNTSQPPTQENSKKLPELRAEVEPTLTEIEPASRPEKNADQMQVNDVIARAAESEGKPAPNLPDLNKSESLDSDEKKEEKPVAKVEDLSGEVANVLAERGGKTAEEKNSGFMSSIKAMFKRPKSKPKQTPFAAQANNVLKPITTTVVAKPLHGAVDQSSSDNTRAESAQASLVNAVKTVSSPVTTTVARKPEEEKHEPPKELDGRTQLVALAPQDGSVFFEELSQKYSNLAEGQLPAAATVARDMANVDYLTLIKEACGKDLNAFSKLLGLHRVMTESNCPAWVEDMDLLRKGYGDAVLATVVSKYSVSECREILGAVYQRPRTQAAV